MSDGWKLAAVFFGCIGAAAIIYQLNQGTLAQSGFSAISSAISTAFSSSSTSKSTTPTSGSNKKTSHSASYTTLV